MGTVLLALCFCALSLVLALFVGISPISDKAKIRFMYVGAALSLMAVPMMSHYIAGLNDIVDELRYQAVLVFIVVVCCYCFVMANMVKYNVMKKKVAVLEDTVEKLEQERAAAMSQAVDEEQQHKVQEALDWFAAKMSVFSKEEQEAINACAIVFAERDQIKSILPSMPNAAKPTSWRMPVPLSSRLARNVKTLHGFSALYSKLTSLVARDLCIRRCQGRKDSLRSEQYRLLFKISNCSSTLFESLLSIVFQINLS